MSFSLILESRNFTGWRGVGCLWCLSSLSERISRKGVDEWFALCIVITSKATTAKRNKQTHYRK